MSSTKRYNQILFLMTLSVYMGLVLAGGASPALAQAAMAKGFELKTELEAKDDLDKKPDEADLKELSQDLEDYLIESRDLIEALQKLHSSGDFILAKDTIKFLIPDILPCNTDLRKVGLSESDFDLDLFNSDNFSPPSIKKDVDSVIGTALHLGRFADCTTSTYIKGKKASGFSFSVKYDKSGLKLGFGLKLKKSPGKAQSFTDTLFTTFQNFQARENSPTGKALTKNTEITSDNEYISVVTNLPRAGLDDLLAVK